MKEEKEIKNTNIWLIMFLFSFLLIIIGLIIIYRNTIFNKIFENNSESTNKQEDISRNQILDSSSSHQIKSYSAKVFLDYETEKEYKIGDDFSIKVMLGKLEDNLVNYSFKINNSNYSHHDSIQISGEDEAFTLTIYQIGKYFAFENTGKTDSRDTHVFIFDEFGNLYKDLNSIGNKENRDMYIESIKCTERELYINTSRITNDYQIIYNENLIDIDGGEISAIQDNIAVKYQYKYAIDRSGEIDFNNPDEKVLDTWGEFKKRNN